MPHRHTVAVTPEQLVRLARDVQRLPYRWPAPPDAESTRKAGTGSCAGKHALLAENLEAHGIPSAPLLMVGPLAPPLWPDLATAADALMEVHECLTVVTEWAGPLVVDVTWHPSAVRSGMPGLPDTWDGCRDTPTAVILAGAGYSVERRHLRAAKEALRDRLYTAEERDRRDQVLQMIAERAARL